MDVFSLLGTEEQVLHTCSSVPNKLNTPSQDSKRWGGKSHCYNYFMRPNKMRTLLQAGKPTLSTRVQSHWPSIIEVLGHTGMFDYVEFLAEYAPFTLHDLENFCRAAELYDLGTMIKVDPEPRQFLAQRAIGSGFESVLFADVRNVEDAKQCIQIVKPDTPEDGGLYGAATRRFAFMGYGGNAEYVQWLRDAVVVLMIEKQTAVYCLAEILTLGKIDMVQWGPADYSMSVGLAGQRRSTEIKTVERQVIDTCLRMGVPPRIEIASPDEASAYLDIGVRHFSLGSDLAVLFNWWKQNGEKLRSLLDQ
jgi:2-keto-3-deoxy-L-rhamnonate aldolase RhmA